MLWFLVVHVWCLFEFVFLKKDNLPPRTLYIQVFKNTLLNLIV